MRALAGVLLGRALAALSVVVVAGIAARPGAHAAASPRRAPTTPVREQEVRARLVPAVVRDAAAPALRGRPPCRTALLQADRRFVAAALNPVCNNVIVIATMVGVRVVHDPDAGLALTTGEKVLLGGGTLLGTIGLTVVPVIAARRAGLGFRPRWCAPGVTGLGALARKGAWGAGDIGLNQVLVLATVVFAGRVPGGVIAYQTAFTFFLLPHAVLAHPIFTVRFPELSAHGAAGDNDAFAADVASSMRSMALLLAPAAALMAAMAAPLLALIRVGQLDAQGSELVAAVLAVVHDGAARLQLLLPADPGLVRDRRRALADHRLPRGHRRRHRRHGGQRRRSSTATRRWSCSGWPTAWPCRWDRPPSTGGCGATSTGPCPSWPRSPAIALATAVGGGLAWLAVTPSGGTARGEAFAALVVGRHGRPRRVRRGAPRAARTRGGRAPGADRAARMRRCTRSPGLRGRR